MTYCNILSAPIPTAGGLPATFDEGWNIVWTLKFQFNARSGYCESNRYRKHLKKMFGSVQLTCITPLMLEEMKADYLKSGLSAQTVKHILGLVKRVFNCLISRSKKQYKMVLILTKFALDMV